MDGDRSDGMHALSLHSDRFEVCLVTWQKSESPRGQNPGGGLRVWRLSRDTLGTWHRLRKHEGRETLMRSFECGSLYRGRRIISGGVIPNVRPLDGLGNKSPTDAISRRGTFVAGKTALREQAKFMLVPPKFACQGDHFGNWNVVSRTGIEALRYARKPGALELAVGQGRSVKSH